MVGRKKAMELVLVTTVIHRSDLTRVRWVAKGERGWQSRGLAGTGVCIYPT